MNDDIKLPDDFNWASFTTDAIGFVTNEIFVDRVYDRYRSVQKGDIVVDIGSSVGPFSYISMQRGAKKIYCIEPSEIYIRSNFINHSCFIINSRENPCVFVNHAIGPNTDLNKKPRDSYRDFDGNNYISTISFRDLVSKYRIDTINFLKIDCEGGEYDIFTLDNISYLKNNVDFIACEFHGKYGEDMIEKFHRFRKNILPNFPNHKICCTVDNRFSDITDYFHQSEFNADHVIRRIELMFYISKTPIIEDPTVYVLKPSDVTYVDAPIA